MAFSADKIDLIQRVTVGTLNVVRELRAHLVSFLVALHANAKILAAALSAAELCVGARL